MAAEPITTRIPPIRTMCWIPREDEHIFAASTVSGITLGALAPAKVPGSTLPDEVAPQSNEWFAYFPMNSSLAIRVEAIPYGYEVKKAVILWDQEFELMDPDAIKTAHISFNNHPTVASLGQMVRENGYDKYKFTTDGRGRRWWMYSFVNLLYDHGLFDHEDEYQEAIQALKTVWHSEDIPVQSIHQTTLDSGAGTFFDIPESNGSLMVNEFGEKQD
ncbi:hypothetical protein MMC10_000759 [Thelotrema lepadinum]|nr:hypothetical protein [Thelotrema lepadinum]